jgi:hypothetical protein
VIDLARIVLIARLFKQNRFVVIDNQVQSEADTEL